ncbi:MAG: hypothetical protein WBC87_23430, partial [Pseudolabrys sp.]
NQRPLWGVMTQSGPLSANQLHAPADGLSISHDVSLKQHGGSIDVDTQPGEFTSGPFCHTRLRPSQFYGTSVTVFATAVFDSHNVR